MTHALHLTVAITREDEWYVVRCLQVEVASQGAIIGEALANLREALELYRQRDVAEAVIRFPGR